MSRTRALKRERKAKFDLRMVVNATKEREARTEAVFRELVREVETLRGVQEAFRAHIFGAMLSRALGDEEKFSDALLKAFPEWFRGHEEAPWMALSER